MAKREPKYGPLGGQLSAASHPTTMSFAEISGLVGGLPASAYRYPAWWANDRTHVQARAWLDAGLRVEAVNLGQQVVAFSPGQEDGAIATSSPAEYQSLYETRNIEQYPTIGPRLVVHWFVTGSVVIEVGAGLGREWMIASVQAGDRDGAPTILRLEPRWRSLAHHELTQSATAPQTRPAFHVAWIKRPRPCRWGSRRVRPEPSRQSRSRGL